ncbi:hypothetical protein ESCO106038_21040 [Escherichia coli]
MKQCIFDLGIMNYDAVITWTVPGVSLDIENYCTLRLFFDLVDLN